MIDLSEVTFMSSSLIHWLLRVEHALELGDAVTLSVVTGPPSGVVATLFAQLRVNHILACYETRSCRPFPVPTPWGSRSARIWTQDLAERWCRPARHLKLWDLLSWARRAATAPEEKKREASELNLAVVVLLFAASAMVAAVVAAYAGTR